MLDTLLMAVGGPVVSTITDQLDFKLNRLHQPPIIQGLRTYNVVYTTTILHIRGLAALGLYFLLQTLFVRSTCRFKLPRSFTTTIHVGNPGIYPLLD